MHTDVYHAGWLEPKNRQSAHTHHTRVTGGGERVRAVTHFEIPAPPSVLKIHIFVPGTAAAVSRIATHIVHPPPPSQDSA